MNTSSIQTYMCFCSLPEAEKTRFDDVALGSAVILTDDTVRSVQSAEVGRDYLKIIASHPITLMSCVITNKRYQHYKTMDKDVPHTMLASMLLERVGYCKERLHGGFNTFLSSPRPDDYQLTLRKLLLQGIREEEHGFSVSKKLFGAINCTIADPAFVQKFSAPFGIAEYANRLLLQRLTNLPSQWTVEERAAWNALRQKYYKSTDGKLEGYGIKLYPDEYLYQRL